MKTTFFRTACALAMLWGTSLGAVAQDNSAQNNNAQDGAKQDQEIFSGPQAGEKLPAFEFRAIVPGPAEVKKGENCDPVTKADGGPIALVFVHEFTRPSIGLTRTVMQYAGTLAEKGLTGGVVYLHDDPTEAESQLNRAVQALPKNVTIGISNDGKEGPGSYGLNRNVALTVLIAKDNKVLANFALVQPSVQADSLKIATEIAKAVGADPPTAEQLNAGQDRAGQGRAAQRMRAGGQQQDPALRDYLAPVIQKDATPEQVDAAVAKLEAYVKEKPEVKKQVGDIARRIIDAGVLQNYGTASAQAYLKTWAETWGVDK